MGLSDAAREARQLADRTGDPADEMVARGLEAVEAYAARDLLETLAPDRDTEGIPPPLVAEVWIPRPDGYRDPE